MNRCLAVLLCILCCLTSVAQLDRKFSYLVIQLELRKDRNREDSVYFMIKSETSVPAEIAKLVDYDPRSSKGRTATFFFNKSDSDSLIYNYFRSANEALLFLGDRSWELVSVNSNIRSEGDVRLRFLDSDVPYTKIYTEPVFYFKKQRVN